MYRIQIIANPRAGKTSLHEILRSARRQLFGWQMDLAITADAADIPRCLDSINADTHKAIVVIGGDGSINCALPYLITRDDLPPLALYPSGTANDLAQCLKIRDTWPDIQYLLDHDLSLAIDVIQVNGKHWFLTAGGLGIGSIITTEINSWRSKSRLFSKAWTTLGCETYALFAAKAIGTSQSIMQNMRIRAESFHHEGCISSLLICNQEKMGGELTIAPGANNHDGYFDLVGLHAKERLVILKDLYSARFKGGLPADFALKSESCVIENLDNKPMTFFGDGECLAKETTFEIQIKKKALKVFTPLAVYQDSAPKKARGKAP